MKTIGELLARDEINAAAVLALSGTLVVLVAKGDGSLSLKRMVSALLSNPIPGLSLLRVRVISTCPSKQPA
jgi:hypothetical protein